MTNPNLDRHEAFPNPHPMPPKVPKRMRPYTLTHIGPYWVRVREKVAWTLGIIAFISFCVWVVVSVERHDAEWRQDPTNPVNVCIAKGGVPATNGDHLLLRCDFPPK